VAIVLSAAMMLRHLAEPDAASAVESAVHRVLAEHEHVTRDLGGTASTREMAEAIASAVREAMAT
jgi:isocitrate/isopropylmalate dehydrogenase